MFRNILLTPQEKTDCEPLIEFTSDWDKIREAYHNNFPKETKEKSEDSHIYYLLKDIGKELENTYMPFGFMSKPYISHIFAQTFHTEIYLRKHQLIKNEHDEKFLL